jgi:PIN domain nuclease of toxin-antitoxin system
MEVNVVKAFLDTHSAIFLWEGRVDIWGAKSRNLLERAQLYISPLIRLELKYLQEVGKLKVTPDEIIGGLVSDCGVIVSDDRIEEVVSKAMSLTWTRDPFDRLMVATAVLHHARFITKDRRIHKNSSISVW